MQNIKILPDVTGYNGISGLVAIDNLVIKIDNYGITELKNLLEQKIQIKNIKINRWNIQITYISPRTGEEYTTYYRRENPNYNYNAFLDEDCDN